MDEIARGGSEAVVHFLKGNNEAPGFKPTVFCDGVALARLGRGRYFTVKLSPGKHFLQADSLTEKGVIAELKGGEEYYFYIQGTWGGERVKVVPDPAGPTLAQDLKYVKPDWIKDPRVSPTP